MLLKKILFKHLTISNIKVTLFIQFMMIFLFNLSFSQNFEDYIALTNGTIIPSAGETIKNGTIIIRNGLIDQIGKNIPIQPDVRIIDISGLYIYPGIINATSHIGIPVKSNDRQNSSNRQQEDVKISKPEEIALNLIVPGSNDIKKARESGTTTALVIGKNGIFRGQSTIINLSDESVDKLVIKTPFAQHLSFNRNPKGYPSSLMGIISFQRQTFLDAIHHKDASLIYDKNKNGLKRPSYNKSLEALIPVIDKKMPVVINANKENEIRRAIKIANEYNLDYIISGAVEGFLAVEYLKKENKPVIVSLKFPEPKSLTGYDFALKTKGRRIVSREKNEKNGEDKELKDKIQSNASILHKNGIKFAFSMGLDGKPEELLKNTRTAVKHGLPEEIALKSLTINAAEILGIDEQLTKKYI